MYLKYTALVVITSKIAVFSNVNSMKELTLRALSAIEF